MFGISQLFNISYFAFLRKYAAVKKEFQLMNYGITRFEVRNIPIGSDRFYVCFPQCCLAHGYDAIRNKKGEVIELINRQEAKFQEEVDSYIDMTAEPEEEHVLVENTYPTADPYYRGIYIYEDEKLNFQPGNSFLAKKEKAAAAVNELRNNEGSIFLNVKQLRAWLRKHSSFYWGLQLQWNYKAFSEFYHWYFHLQFLAEEIDNTLTAKQAVEEYIPFDDDWLYKYDRFFYCKFNFQHREYSIWSENPFILEQTYQSIYLVGEEFKYLYKFSIMFERETKRYQKEEEEEEF